MTNESLCTKLALRELVDEYAVVVDQRDATGFADLFTPNGCLEIYEPGAIPPVLTYTGTDDLKAVINLVSVFDCTFHVMANHLAKMTDATEASGITYCQAHHFINQDGDSKDTLMLIRYDDKYRFHQGRWRFERRKVMRQWNDCLRADRNPLAV